MSKASIEADLRDYSEFRKPEEIVFTNANELSKYNEKLLNEFISYLNNRHKQNHAVFYCGVTVQILPDDKLIKDFLNKLNLK